MRMMAAEGEVYCNHYKTMHSTNTNIPKLFSAQPLLLKKAEFKKYASWNVLRYFIPITIVSTPLGQITGDIVSTDMIGFLVTFVGHV